MISHADAVKRILKHVPVLEAEKRPVLHSVDQVMAQDVYADFSLPLSHTSGRDGYAVRSADIRGASGINPVILRVIETVKAGSLPKKVLGFGTATRIMTGSVLPKGADCVVRFEETNEPGGKNGPGGKRASTVEIYFPAPPGMNIIRAGANVRRGSLVLSKGTVIGPAQISALITSGTDRVKVIRRPVIAVIATGDELVYPGTVLTPGKVFNSNAPAMAAMVAHYGGIPKLLGIARDNAASVLRKIRKGLEADAIITTGGVSMGDYDLVRMILGRIGEIVFSRINMGPGAGVVFGLVNRPMESGIKPVPVFALAGPPNGCLINFETLVRPALLKMRGFKRTTHPSIEAVAADSLPDKRTMPFAKWTRVTRENDKYRVELNMGENVGGLASMASANSLTIIPEGSAIKAGDKVRVLPLDWCRRDLNL